MGEIIRLSRPAPPAAEPAPHPVAACERLTPLDQVWPFPILPRFPEAFAVLDGVAVWQRSYETAAAFKRRVAAVAKACNVSGEVQIWTTR